MIVFHGYDNDVDYTALVPDLGMRAGEKPAAQINPANQGQALAI
jgi:hypothetical protein